MYTISGDQKQSGNGAKDAEKNLYIRSIGKKLNQTSECPQKVITTSTSSTHADKEINNFTNCRNFEKEENHGHMLTTVTKTQQGSKSVETLLNLNLELDSTL